MDCPNCGNEIPENQKFCKFCGEALEKTVPDADAPVGFSEKIADPAFAKYKKHSRIWSFLFASILAVIASVGFPIYGKYSGEIDWPYSLYYGFGIGGMFLLIALLQTLKRGIDKTWDGTVEDKRDYQVRTRRRDGRTTYRREYVLKVRKDGGGLKKHKWVNATGLYDYYKLGDRVRHHKGLQYYEKYDKSADEEILCAACLAFVDRSKDQCPRCKCPLLK